MINTNIRKIDELGRIVLPLELRQAVGWEERTPLEIHTDGNCIILQKHVPCCIYCGATENLKEYATKHLCANCQAAISAL